MNCKNNKWIIFAIIFGVLAHLLMSINTPVTMVADGNYDDQLYMKLAAYILGGQWLGPYDGQTLQKGIGTPLYLALVSAFGISFRVAQSLTYSLGVTFVALALRQLGASRRVVWGAWAMALLSPHFWDDENTRISRDVMLGTLTLWMFGFGLWMIHRQKQKSSYAWVWGLIAGFFWGWHWATREESPWSIAPMVIIGALSVWVLTKQKTAPLTRYSGALALISGFLLFGLWNHTMNLWWYKTFDSIEVRQKEFNYGYSALARILPKPKHPWTVVSKANIAKLRTVSPTFDKIMTAFPEELVNFMCFDDACKGEYSSGWWMSGLKTAAYKSGLTPNAVEAKKVWLQVADEVNSACDRGEIQCGPWRKTLIPEITWSVAWQTFLLATKNLGIILDYSVFHFDPQPSRGSPYLQKFFADMLNVPLVFERTGEVLRVQVELPAPATSVSVEEAIAEDPRGISVYPLPAHTGESKTNYRAEIHYSVPCPECKIVFRSGTAAWTVPLVSLQNTNRWSEKGITATVEHRFSGHDNKFLPQFARAKLITKLQYGWLAVYKVLIYLWTAFGLFWLFKILRTSRRRWVTISFAGICLLAIYGRLGVLALTEVTSMYTTTPLYFAPLYPLLVLWPAFVFDFANSRETT